MQAGHRMRDDAGPVEPVVTTLGRDNLPTPRATFAEGPGSRWHDWRLRLLFIVALVLCAGIAWLADSLAEQNRLKATWRSNAAGRIELATSSEPVLQPFRDAVLASVGDRSSQLALPDALALHRSTRWIVDDDQRERHPALQAALAEALGHERVRLGFADGRQLDLVAERRGVLGLPAMFWLFSLLAFGMCMSGTVIALGKPGAATLLYALMAWCQAGNLLFIAVESTADLGLAAWFSRLNLPLRQSFDLATAAAFVHIACLRPLRLPRGDRIAAAGWGIALLVAVAGAADMLAHSWWWTQLTVGAGGLAAIGVLRRSHSIEPHPYAVVLGRMGVVAVGTWLLLTVAIAAAERFPGSTGLVIALGPTVWYVFLASLLLLAPMLSRSQQAVREFSLLAAISTIATSLDLFFVAVFSLGQFTSLTLSLFLSLAAYAGARQWILDRLLGNAVLTTERTFEYLYQTVREVERRPEHAPELLAQLLRRLFEPVEVRLIDGNPPAPSVTRDGGAMTVPLPTLGAEPASQSLLLRFAHHGRHLFTRQDARLAERIVEQLERAVRFDQAVEQGRSEERTRLAQDLHDDIGARLLTLMYEAATPEMEAYLRHTLQDLKTLTRGLVASNHRLADAAAEWKVDIAQRLTAAGIVIAWHTAFDADPALGVGQWSALTRVLRELASNAIAHAHATRIEVDIGLDRDCLHLVVSDDGIGVAPEQWVPGLGLGGVKKRVRQLGGEIEWLANPGGGIRCEVMVRLLAAQSPDGAPARR